ncbi:hypothetical protein WH8501_18230 [Crocosphaera watsonii WH 8501]|uniref:hypothetical protein n=1 Tax=Crocosphaera watsonii TaxID=263511 RepID=UPI003D30205E
MTLIISDRCLSLKLLIFKLICQCVTPINVSAVAIMVVVTLNLLYQILWVPTDGLPVNWEAILIIILAGFALFKYKLNAAWVVLGSSIIGWGLSYI